MFICAAWSFVPVVLSGGGNAVKMPVVSKHCLVQRLWEVALRFNHAVGYGALSRSWQNYWASAAEPASISRSR